MTTNTIFFNQVFDKKRLKVLIAWVFKEFGEKQALRVVEELKTIGFHNATQAGLSIGLNDLTTPSQKSSLLSKAELDMSICDQAFNGGYITATERNQRIVDTWHRVSETLRKQVVEHFSTYDQLNPVYIMALSGARGNFSQVRQLVGMRGLMADPQGQIISFPIRSNLREGLTLTEYFISCSGARKGLVDTALRTADTGYLTRRLVDVSHHIVIKKICCNTEKGITVRALKSENKLLLSLKDRLIGRVLAENIEYSAKHNKTIQNEESPSLRMVIGREDLKSKTSSNQNKNAFAGTSIPVRGLSTPNKVDLYNTFLAQKNQEIEPTLAFKIQTVREQVVIRSPLTCALTHSVCQLCYGWSLSQGRLVSLGEAVGVIAAQSIGEPGTQLTMRTFHTGGVFSGDLLQEIRAPHSGKIEFSKAFQGLMIRTTDGRIAFLTKTSGEIVLKGDPVEEKPKKSFLPLNFIGGAPSYTAVPKDSTEFTKEKLLQQVLSKSNDLARKKLRLPKSSSDSRAFGLLTFCCAKGIQRSWYTSKFLYTQLGFARGLATPASEAARDSTTPLKTPYKNTSQIFHLLVEFYKDAPYEPFYPVTKQLKSKDPFTKVVFSQAKIHKVYLKSKYTLPILAGRDSVASYNFWQNKLARTPLFDPVQNVLLLNSDQNKIVLFNKITKYCLLYNYNKTKRNANKTNSTNNQIEQVNKKTCLQFQALSLLFVRQSEYVSKNQLLAQISILGEEGNQPIKSRQTIFAQLSGKVFETQGAISSKKFIKNINKLSKNAETIVFKNELVNTLKGRASTSIQPEKSAKLGFFHILATQISASFGSNGFGSVNEFNSCKKDFLTLYTSSETKDHTKSLAFTTEFSNSRNLAKSKDSDANPFSKAEIATLFTSPSLYQGSTRGIRGLKNYQKTHSCYNPYTAQFFSSPQNESVIISLLRKQTLTIKKVKLSHLTSLKQSEFFDQKQQNSDCLFLRTIAQEGDLVDANYKKCLF